MRASTDQMITERYGNCDIGFPVQIDELNYFMLKRNGTMRLTKKINTIYFKKQNAENHNWIPIYKQSLEVLKGQQVQKINERSLIFQEVRKLTANMPEKEIMRWY